MTRGRFSALLPVLLPALVAMLATLGPGAWRAAAAQGAAPVGSVTLLEGPAQVFRGLGRVQAAEGVKLAGGDILETTPATAFLQLETPEQVVLQVGPSTRLWLAAPAARYKTERGLYLMNGWLKLDAAQRAANAPALDLKSPQFDLPAANAVVVVRLEGDESSVFVERGNVRLAERQAGGAPVLVSLKAGDLYWRKAGGRGTVAPDQMAGFIKSMPRIFRDPPPRRLERWKDQEVAAKAGPDIAYADVEAWLKAEPAVRRPLMQRWRAKAKEGAFRAALTANLGAHPEWDPILFPEKYLPKTPPPVRSTAASAPRP